MVTNQDAPICTIVIPCYNYGEFVVAAIESALRQTLKNIEVIVVDAGSTSSETIEVLRGVSDSRVRVYFREGRNLVGSNRNFGIERSRSKYVCCLDADDTLEPTYIEKAIFMMETYGYDIISTGLRFVGAQSGTYTINQFPDLDLMTKGNHVHTCAVFTRSVWEMTGGFHDVGLGKDHIAEDWDLWMRSSAMGARIRNITREYLLNYRIHPKGSLSHSPENPTLIQQRDYILNRSAHLFTPDAFERSTANRFLKNVPAKEDNELLRNSNASHLNERTILLALPWLLVGGVERLMSELVGHLTATGWRVIVVTTKVQSPESGDTSSWIQQHTDELYMLPNFLEPDEYNSFLDYLIYSRKISCVINAGSRVLYEALPRIKEKFFGICAIDFLFNVVGHTKSHLEFRTYFDAVLAENDDVSRWFKENGWAESKVRKVSSGVNLEEYKPVGSHGMGDDQLAALDADVLIGFSGRLSVEKNPELFLEIAEACSDLENVRFQMTGGGHLAAKIKEMAAGLSVNTKFQYLGIVDDVAQYLQSFDILVLPSTVDGRPFVIMEAMASGTAILASSVGGLPEMIADGENGWLVHSNSVNEYSQRIRQLVADRALLRDFKKRSRELAEERFDCRRMYSEFERKISETVFHQSVNLEN